MPHAYAVKKSVPDIQGWPEPLAFIYPYLDFPAKSTKSTLFITYTISIH
jgi:hypothetical protein